MISPVCSDHCLQCAKDARNGIVIAANSNTGSPTGEDSHRFETPGKNKKHAAPAQADSDERRSSTPHQPMSPNHGPSRAHDHPAQLEYSSNGCAKGDHSNAASRPHTDDQARTESHEEENASALMLLSMATSGSCSRPSHHHAPALHVSSEALSRTSPDTHPEAVALASAHVHAQAPAPSEQTETSTLPHKSHTDSATSFIQAQPRHLPGNSTASALAAGAQRDTLCTPPPFHRRSVQSQGHSAVLSLSLASQHAAPSESGLMNGVSAASQSPPPQQLIELPAGKASSSMPVVCTHLKTKFNSTANSKRRVQTLLFWKRWLGVSFPVTDSMLRDYVWKNLESCDYGIK